MTDLQLILLILSGFCLLMTVLQTVLNKRVWMPYPLCAMAFLIAWVLVR